MARGGSAPPSPACQPRASRASSPHRAGPAAWRPDARAKSPQRWRRSPPGDGRRHRTRRAESSLTASPRWEGEQHVGLDPDRCPRRECRNPMLPTLSPARLLWPQSSRAVVRCAAYRSRREAIAPGAPLTRSLGRSRSALWRCLLRAKHRSGRTPVPVGLASGRPVSRLHKSRDGAPCTVAVTEAAPGTGRTSADSMDKSTLLGPASWHRARRYRFAPLHYAPHR
jgi:hypothetical protein